MNVSEEASHLANVTFKTVTVGGEGDLYWVCLKLTLTLVELK